VFYAHRVTSFLDYSVCAFLPSNGNENGVSEKIREISYENFSPHSTLTGKAKIQGFLEKFT